MSQIKFAVIKNQATVTGCFLFWKGSEILIYLITLMILLIILGLCLFQGILGISEYLYRLRELALMYDGKIPLMVQERAN